MFFSGHFINGNEQDTLELGTDRAWEQPWTPNQQKQPRKILAWLHLIVHMGMWRVSLHCVDIMRVLFSLGLGRAHQSAVGLMGEKRHVFE